MASPTSLASSLPAWSGAEVVPSISAGLVNGILIVIFQSAYAALIFSGDLTPFLSRGIGIMLFGAVVMGAIVALTSSFHSTVTAPQDAPTAIMALIAAGIVARVGVGNMEAFATVVAAMAFTALATGLTLWLLGHFQLGNLIRFIPYPVVGGFLAGTGWVLLTGALRIMSGRPFQLARLPEFVDPATVVRWLPGVVFALVLYIGVRRIRHYLFMPIAIASTIALFYLTLTVSGVSIDDARAMGLLLPASQGGIGWSLPFPEISAAVNWSVLAEQIGGMSTILFICIISLLLNATGLELIVRQEIDLNRELRSTGLANIISGIGGSSVGYMSLSLAAFGFRMGSRLRVSGLVSSGLCGLVLLSGATVSAYFPVPLLGGLLLFLGLSFLVEWLYSAWFRLPRLEYFLVVVILGVIASVGFLQGTVVGVSIAVGLFVVNYSRAGVIKHELDATTFQSNVDRATLSRRLLDTIGESVYVLQLQGYVFFGTANDILERVKRRVYSPDQHAVSYVILDFRLVAGLDSSALNSFEKMRLLAQNMDISLVFTHLSPAIRRAFSLARLVGDAPGHIRLFPDLDHGIEWAENQLLESGAAAEVGEADVATGEAFLTSLLTQRSEGGTASLSDEAIQALMPYVTHAVFEDGDFLIRQGHPPVGLYIIERGQVTAQLERDDGPLRLRKMERGTVVGEVGLYLGVPASASVVANGPCAVWHLSVEAMARLEQGDPRLAAAFHRWIICILGERLRNSNRSLQAFRRA